MRQKGTLHPDLRNRGRRDKKRSVIYNKRGTILGKVTLQLADRLMRVEKVTLHAADRIMRVEKPIVQAALRLFRGEKPIVHAADRLMSFGKSNSAACTIGFFS